MSNRVIHDVAWPASLGIVEVFAPLLRPEEQKEALAEVYERVKKALEDFKVQADRMQQRLQPRNGVRGLQ